MSKFAVIGSGSWGMAIANHIANKGYEVKVWSFTEEERDLINNERKCKFIDNVVLSDKISCSLDIKEVVEGVDYIFHVTPSKFARNVFNSYKDYIDKDTGVVICSKGFEASSLKTLDEVFMEEKSDLRLAVFSGPSYASEVMQKIPTAVILASKDDALLEELSVLISNESMRVYKSYDLRGVEVGGALKNIIAFCAGVCAELNFGTNAQAALIARGLAEIARLGVKMGGNNASFYGLSGLGDLILTCSSDESRNRRAGKLIGRGLTVEEAKKEIGQTIESLDNIEIAKKLSEKYDVEMPIVNAVYDALYNGLTPEEATKKLMTRDLKFEAEN